MAVHVFCPFSNCFVLLLSFESSLYILDVRLLSNMWFTNIFSQFIACLFIFLTGSFTEQRFLLLMRSNYQIFLSWIVLLLSRLTSLHLVLDPKDFLMFSRNSFIVLCFTFKCLSHFESICISGVRFRWRLILPMDAQHSVLKTNKQTFPSSTELLFPFVKNQLEFFFKKKLLVRCICVYLFLESLLHSSLSLFLC